jgi:methylmalonyl-CoA mutase cobalamin-binding domain/chain
MNIQWEDIKNDFLCSLLSENKENALRIAEVTLEKGVTAQLFFETCIMPALVEIGEKFMRLDIFLPEMIAAAEIVKVVNEEVIGPQIEKLKSEKIVSKGKVLLATIQGDVHDIGKNMVNLMLTVNGFDVVDLGVDVAPTKIIEKAEQEEVDIIGMSSLLTSCLPYMKDVVDLLKTKGLRDKYKVIIGGAAPTADYASKMGVDAQGHSAAEAVRICVDFLES